MMLRRNAKSTRIGNSTCSTPDLSPLRPASPKGNKIEQSSNIKVVARFRPLNELEKVIYIQSLESSEIICNCIDDRTFTIDHGKEFETFTFDKVFSPEATQQEVFEFVGDPVIEDVLNGYNGTVFAYGQTGSGKTYTMMGVDIYDEEHRGIIPRAATQVFAAIETADRDVEFTFTCSMLEIYKETLKDLLEPSAKELKIKEDPRRGIYVAGLREVSVVSDDEMMQIIHVGEQTRTVATTRMNSVSSRSHQLFMLQVRQKLPNDTEKRGILNLIDLAGSEKVNHSGVTGNKLEETKKINLSLSALGNVIHALILKNEHIPYRDSKLTRLLQESLGGNYKTTLVIACSPSPRNLEESLNTIKFAQRAKTVKNNVKMNIKKSPEIYMKIIEKLKKQLLDAKSEISVLKEITAYNEEDTSKFITPAKLNRQYSERVMINTRKIKRCSTSYKGDLDDTKTMTMDESVSDKRVNCSIFEPDSLTSSFLCDRKDTQETDRFDMSKYIDNEMIRSYVGKYEEKITQLEEENRFLKNEKENYEEKIVDLEKKLFISRQKQLSAEQKSHEYYESYHKTLYLINKDASESVLVKKQNASLLKQVKKLTNQLQELDTKFRSFVNNVLEMKGSTQMEFEDRTEEFLEDCGAVPVFYM
jgi:kinesin family protein 5